MIPEWLHLLSKSPIAHRGLWRPDGAPENSIAAFEAARLGRFGVEMDVRLVADGEAVVFHDADLERMTGQPGAIRNHTSAELRALRLLGGSERVPTLAEALEAVGPENLVLVELKTGFDKVGPLESRVAEVLAAHPGPAAVIGFNPESHAWFAENRPHVPRGLNSHAYVEIRAEGVRRGLAAFEHLPIAQAEFILPALDILDTPAVAALRARPMPVIAWTVRTPRQRTWAEAFADTIIFEGHALDGVAA